MFISFLKVFLLFLKSFLNYNCKAYADDEPDFNWKSILLNDDLDNTETLLWY